MKIKFFGDKINLTKAIKGNDPGQINIFGQPIAGAEKEFAPGDKRRLEVTGGGKLRWKNADKKDDQAEETNKEPWEMTKDEYNNLVGKNPGRYDKNYQETPEYKKWASLVNQHYSKVEQALKDGKDVPIKVLHDYPDLKHKYKPFKVPTFGVAMNENFKLPERKDVQEIIFPMEEARRAYSHMSMDPGGRAKMEKEEYETSIKQLEEMLNKEAAEDKKDLIPSIIEKFKQDYIDNRKRVFRTAEGVASPMVAGPSKFNHKQAARRGNIYDNAVSNFSKWFKEETKRIEGLTGVTENRNIEAEKKSNRKTEARLKAKEMLVQKWNDLKVGDLIDVGGNSPVKIEKKNGFSVVTNSGVKWTLKELWGIEHSEAKSIMEKNKFDGQTPSKKKEITAPSYRPLQEGEEIAMERKYKAYKELKFFAAHETIETPDDVAYLFNQLQDEAVEHGFIAHETKDHGIIVQHISTGTFNASMFDPKQIWDAIDRFGSVKIHMVHNHPSGNLAPSQEDMTVWRKIKEGLPRNVEMMPGVIIDAREGSYCFFEPDGAKNGEKQMPATNNKKDALPIKALRFSRQVFKENATLPKTKITEADLIVKFIYQGKYTVGDKAQVFALTTRNSVVGRFNITSSLDDPKQVADEIAVLLGRSGGVNAIVSTNRENEIGFMNKLRAIKDQLMLKEIALFDCILLDKKNKDNWKSAVSERFMEEAPEYKKSMFRTLLKAFGQQISLFGNTNVGEAYGKEGQTKEGKGGTLQLTRDKTGKGAHWRILNKKEGAKDEISTEEGSKTKGKIISPSQAYDLLQDKLGNKTFVTDKDGNLLGEGTFQLINENSEGNYSLFLSEKNGYDSVIPVPKNQAAMVMEGGVQFNFTDKNITVSTKEKSQDKTKPIEIEKAEENAKRARQQEKMRNYNRWNEKAEDFAELGRGQKNWFFNDLEDVANTLGLEFSHNNRIVKNSNTLFKEIKHNATKYDKEEVHSALIGAFAVGSTYKMKRIISELKDKGYSIDVPDIVGKENFFTRVKIRKGENDPCPKELQFATPELAKAAEDCAKKANPLRESETSLKLKVDAEKIPEYNSIKKKLFNQAGEGLGQLWITGGLPGSGKSSVLGGGFHKNKIIVDPDSIKYMIAEERGITKEDVNKKPWELHEDSSTLAKHLTREAVRDGKDIIYDVTMKGTENLSDILELVKSDTFQANAKFIHIPLEKGIERDKKRGENGGRSIGAEIYKKLFSDYPTHKAFFQLKDDFDNFDVYDNSAPLGEGAKLFYQKTDGREEIHEPSIYNEFQKIGRTKVEKSLSLTQPNKMGNEEMNLGNVAQSDGDKIKMLLGFDEDHELDPEQDFFELGVLKMHGLIDENMMLTPEGEQKFEEKFGSKIPMEDEENKTDFDSILNPKKNVSGSDEEKENEL